jgi:diguanylate cyclase (GGDEF)-like protein
MIRMLRKPETAVHDCEWRQRAELLYDQVAEFRESVPYQDPRSGLANPNMLQRDAMKWIARYHRTGAGFGVALIEVETSTGALALPDEVHEAVAGVVVGSARTEDTAARIGPLTFVVLLADTGLAGAQEFAARTGRMFASLCIHVDGHPVFVTATFGCAAWTNEMSRLEDLLDAADADIVRYARALDNHRAAFEGR